MALNASITRHTKTNFRTVDIKGELLEHLVNVER
jgi:hypothetical protein